MLFRRRDGALVLPLTVNIVEVFREHLESRMGWKEVRAAAMIKDNKVQLISKGKCQFQVIFYGFTYFFYFFHFEIIY